MEDGAGQERTTRYGAFGEPLEVERTLTQVAGLDPDWSNTVALESTGYGSTSAFDALGRRARAFLPDGTEREEDYLRSGPFSALRVRTPDGQTRTILAGAEYNARGQRTKSELGNEVEVTSTYDAQTFRLHQRRAALPGTDPYQDLRHHYDPVGNLVYLDDLAQRPTATRVINGLTVTAERTYRYDARYQLTEATGRVHNALTQPDFRGDIPTTGSFRGTRRVGLNDGGAVSRYQRTYSYDDGGNLTGWAHGPQGTNPGNTWTNEKWVSPTSNRSFPTYDLNGVPVSAPESKFDARGQLTSLPSVRAMEWSVRGQLRRTVLIERAGGIDDDERYDYAADNVRLRKVTRRLVSGNVETTETIYLDGCELRRMTLGSTVILERWSSHAEDGESRLATVYRWDTDTHARETDIVSSVRTHYHLGGKLGSVALEVGAGGEILSYEEYFPYGRTAFLAGNSVREIQFRTLRYVGKDQDDATGFYVFQYRYYAPFLGSWATPDPAGEVDGPNRYVYCRNNPVRTVDPQGLWGLDWDFDLASGSLAFSLETPFVSARASVSASEGVSARVEASAGSLDIQVSSGGARAEVHTSEISARVEVDSQEVQARVETRRVRARAEVSRRRGIDVAIETSEGSTSVHIQDPISELERAAECRFSASWDHLRPDFFRLKGPPVFQGHGTTPAGVWA